MLQSAKLKENKEETKAVNPINIIGMTNALKPTAIHLINEFLGATAITITIKAKKWKSIWI